MVMAALIVGSVFWMIHNNTNKESSAEKLRLTTEIGAIDDAVEINLKYKNIQNTKKLKHNIFATNKKRE